MINLHNVNFAYDKSLILEDLTLREQDPVITGVWGRNGSGKTTLMKILSGQNKADSGTAEILGQEPYNNSEAARNICYMQENHPFPSLWTVQDAMRFGKYFNENWDQETAEQLKKLFRLPDKKKIRKFSKGMKSAVQIMIGLASFADLTILDEPTNGLDAAIRKKFYKSLLESYEKKPRLILLSSHHIEEIQLYCESLIVIHKKQVLLHEPMECMREKGVWITGEKTKVESFVKDKRILEQNMLGQYLRVMVDLPYTTEWMQAASGQGVSMEKADLQDYLLNLTGGDV